MKAMVSLIPPLVGWTFDNLQTQVANTEFSLLQFSSVIQLCPTLCDPMDYSTPAFPLHHQLPELTQTHVHRVMMPSNHLILCRPLLFLPSIFPSIRVFSNESTLHIKWPKYWSFSFSICPSNEYSGLISFRIDWFDLLAIQRTLKSLLQQHSSKASVLQLSVFFMVQLYIHTRLLETPELWLYGLCQQSDSVVHIQLFSHLGYSRILSRVPCAI